MKLFYAAMIAFVLVIVLGVSNVYAGNDTPDFEPGTVVMFQKLNIVTIHGQNYTNGVMTVNEVEYQVSLANYDTNQVIEGERLYPYNLTLNYEYATQRFEDGSTVDFIWSYGHNHAVHIPMVFK
jgi:hypothetical protein